MFKLDKVFNTFYSSNIPEQRSNKASIWISIVRINLKWYFFLTYNHKMKRTDGTKYQLWVFAIYPMNYIFAPIMTYNTYIFMTYSIYNIFKQLLCLTCKFKTERNAGKSRVSLFWPIRSAVLEPGKWKTWNRRRSWNNDPKKCVQRAYFEKMFSTGKSKFFSGKEGLESLPLTRERPSLGLPIPCLGEAHLKSSPNVKWSN